MKKIKPLILVKGIKPNVLNGYKSQARTFLKKAKFPVLAVPNKITFYCPSWEEKISKNKALYNNWIIDNFDWEIANLSIKYLI